MSSLTPVNRLFVMRVSHSPAPPPAFFLFILQLRSARWVSLHSFPLGSRCRCRRRRHVTGKLADWNRAVQCPFVHTQSTLQCTHHTHAHPSTHPPTHLLPTLSFTNFQRVVTHYQRPVIRVPGELEHPSLLFVTQ